jgi:hypothetical protein
MLSDSPPFDEVVGSTESFLPHPMTQHQQISMQPMELALVICGFLDSFVTSQVFESFTLVAFWFAFDSNKSDRGEHQPAAV